LTHNTDSLILRSDIKGADDPIAGEIKRAAADIACWFIRGVDAGGCRIPAREPMPRNTKRQGMRNELGLVITDRGDPLVPSPGMAHPETGRAGLNEPFLLGREQNRETQRGKTVRGAVYFY
jgi:hypothetical protein